jgi:pimeloyl-ACP methyl ester carboxylesterase
MADDRSAAIEPPLDEKLDDDEPVRLTPDLPPEVASPLAPFAGARPPSPAWFDAAIANAPERRMVTVEGARIELLAWGEVGRPGLIFVHGNSAHADWWSFIAPFLADAYRVAAISLSGMGDSDWRETYTFETFASEIWACAQAAGLYEAPVRPVYIGHSFGGSQVFYSAARHPERMRAALLLDTGFGGPPTREQEESWRREAERSGDARWRGPPNRTRPNRVYPTLEAALVRFRFMPPQVPGNLFIADYIARRSLKRAPMPDGSGEGWTWKFDPFLWSKLDRSAMSALVPSGGPPIAQMFGDRSAIMRRREAGEMMAFVPPGVPSIAIPDSEHHIMVDQPLALVAALRSLLAVWPA